MYIFPTSHQVRFDMKLFSRVGGEGTYKSRRVSRFPKNARSPQHFIFRYVSDAEQSLPWGRGLLGPGYLLNAGAVEYTNCISVEGQVSFNECPGYDTKQSDNEAPVMLELWGLWSFKSSPSLLGPLWSGVVAPDRVISMGQIELFDIIIYPTVEH